MKKLTALILSIILIFSVLYAALPSFAAGEFEHVVFGSYPKTKVSDAELIARLNALVSDGSFTSYGFYSGNGEPGSEAVEDYTFYADVLLDGVSYRAVTFSKYRPTASYGAHPYYDYLAEQYKNGYFIDEVYWFRYEPISWTVLSRSRGLVMCDELLDTRSFSDRCYDHDINFSGSSLKEWLNSDFTETAFNPYEKSLIDGSVRLLTVSEAQSSEYGLNTSGAVKPYLTAPETDYAQALGLRAGTPFTYTDSGVTYSLRGATYWLDDESSSDLSALSNYCSPLGTITGKAQLYDAYGIRPVMKLELNNNAALDKLPINYYGYYGPDSDRVFTEYYGEGDSLATLLPGEIEGYDFNGWDSEIPSSMPACKLTFTADWQVHTHEVTFLANGGVFASNEEDNVTYSVEYGASVPSEIPEKQGYDFAGWTPEFPSSMPDSDLEFTAVWAPSTNTPYAVKIYKQNADDDGYSCETLERFGTTDSPVSVLPESLENIDLEYFNFVPEMSVTEGVISPDGSTELSLYFDREVFTVTFDFNDGATEGITAQYKYGQTIVAPEPPAVEGYSPQGWYDGDTLFENVCAGNANYTLAWAPNPHCIIFDTDGGNYIGNGNYNYGETVIAPRTPVKTGYEFLGWSPKLPETMPDEDITVTAQWRRITYYATFCIDGEVIETREYYYDDAVTAPEVESREGYDFEWLGLQTKMPAENITVNGVYTIKSYKVSYYADGVKIFEDTVTYGERVPVPASPNKAGFIFSGWSPEVPETMPAHAVNAVAVFIAEPSVQIRGYRQSMNVGWKTSVTFHAAPNSAAYDELVWIINGKEYADDGSRSYTVKDATESYTVACKVTAGGYEAISGTEKVNVDTGFFAKIVYFFRLLFMRSALNINQN